MGIEKSLSELHAFYRVLSETQRIPVIIFGLKFAVSFEWLYHSVLFKPHNKPGNVFRNPTPRMPNIIFFFSFQRHPYARIHASKAIKNSS